MCSQGIQDRFVNPYTDFGFKLLFGTEMNKELLIGFLNALLHGKEVIKDITYLNTEKLGTQEYDRRAVFDVYCVNDRGEHFIVEMQKGEQQFFKDRSVFYSTYAIREQAPKGYWDYELKGVYLVGVLNFMLDDTDKDHYVHEVKLVDLRTKKVFYDKLTFIYLEMPKFTKELHECETLFDKWMFVLHNMAGLMERPAALQERVFKRLFEAASIAKFNKQDLYQYEESLKNYRDWYSVMNTAELRGLERGMQEGLEKGLEKGLEEGLEKGLEKGRAEGKKEALLEMARNFKSKGMNIRTIIEYTGLSENEITDL